MADSQPDPEKDTGGMDVAESGAKDAIVAPLVDYVDLEDDQSNADTTANILESLVSGVAMGSSASSVNSGTLSAASPLIDSANHVDSLHSVGIPSPVFNSSSATVQGKQSAAENEHSPPEADVDTSMARDDNPQLQDGAEKPPDDDDNQALPPLPDCSSSKKSRPVNKAPVKQRGRKRQLPDVTPQQPAKAPVRRSVRKRTSYSAVSTPTMESVDMIDLDTTVVENETVYAKRRELQHSLGDHVLFQRWGLWFPGRVRAIGVLPLLNCPIRYFASFHDDGDKYNRGYPVRKVTPRMDRPPRIREVPNADKTLISAVSRLGKGDKIKLLDGVECTVHNNNKYCRRLEVFGSDGSSGRDAELRRFNYLKVSAIVSVVHYDKSSDTFDTQDVVERPPCSQKAASTNKRSSNKQRVSQSTSNSVHRIDAEVLKQIERLIQKLCTEPIAELSRDIKSFIAADRNVAASNGPTDDTDSNTTIIRIATPSPCPPTNQPNQNQQNRTKVNAETARRQLTFSSGESQPTHATTHASTGSSAPADEEPCTCPPTAVHPPVYQPPPYQYPSQPYPYFVGPQGQVQQPFPMYPYPQNPVMLNSPRQMFRAGVAQSPRTPSLGDLRRRKNLRAASAKRRTAHLIENRISLKREMVCDDADFDETSLSEPSQKRQCEDTENQQPDQRENEEHQEENDIPPANHVETTGGADYESTGFGDYESTGDAGYDTLLQSTTENSKILETDGDNPAPCEDITKTFIDCARANAAEIEARKSAAIGATESTAQPKDNLPAKSVSPPCDTPVRVSRLDYGASSYWSPKNQRQSDVNQFGQLQQQSASLSPLTSCTAPRRRFTITNSSKGASCASGSAASPSVADKSPHSTSPKRLPKGVKTNLSKKVWHPPLGDRTSNNPVFDVRDIVTDAPNKGRKINVVLLRSVVEKRAPYVADGDDGVKLLKLPMRAGIVIYPKGTHLTVSMSASGAATATVRGSIGSAEGRIDMVKSYLVAYCAALLKPFGCEQLILAEPPTGSLPPAAIVSEIHKAYNEPLKSAVESCIHDLQLARLDVNTVRTVIRAAMCLIQSNNRKYLTASINACHTYNWEKD